MRNPFSEIFLWLPLPYRTFMKVKRKSTKRGADCLNEDFGENSTRRIGAYLTAETLETRHKLSHISPFVEVDRLEETGL